ncbi:MAG: CZB domain-containing protein [Bryobacterales bacterium]|nr:CZB domain-containing protein [Bryobacterales bacterium]
MRTQQNLFSSDVLEEGRFIQEKQMDINQAIMAHMNWKQKFRSHLDGKEKLDAATVKRSDACELGKWLAGEGAAHAKLPEFAAVREKHADFHRTAGSVLVSAEKLSKDESLKLIEWSSEFGKATNACVNALAALRDKLAKQ